MNQQKRTSDDEYGKRTMPRLGETLHPNKFFRFLWGFVSGWFLSRDYRLFFIGVPFQTGQYGIEQPDRKYSAKDMASGDQQEVTRDQLLEHFSSNR